MRQNLRKGACPVEALPAPTSQVELGLPATEADTAEADTALPAPTSQVEFGLPVTTHAVTGLAAGA